MKSFFAFILLSVSFVLDIDKTATINRLKKEAEIAFKNRYFLAAAKKYDSLIKVCEVKEPQVYLNLAHCYYQLKDTTQSRRYYRYVTDSVPDRNMRSVAFQQLGNLEAQTRSIPTYQKAVNHFKNALKMQPENQEARHNYEVTRKILNELQQQRQQQQQNQNQQNKDKKEQNEQQKQEEKKEEDKKKEQDKNKNQQKAGEQQDQKDQKKDDQKNPDKNKSDKKDNKNGKKQDDKEGDSKDAEKKDQEGDMKNAKPTEEKGKGEEKEIEANALRSQRLKNMNLTQEAAQMLLDAMKNSETQYLQQNSRKQKKSGKTNSKDW